MPFNDNINNIELPKSLQKIKAGFPKIIAVMDIAQLVLSRFKNLST